VIGRALLGPARSRVYGGVMFHWRQDDPGLTRAFTSRDGGVSASPFAALNIGGHVGDDPAAVAENRRRLAGALDVDPDRLVLMDQCHGADVAVVTDRPAAPPSVDALVTTVPGLALVALVADCTPVLLHDLDGPAVAAVHAGRPGMVKGVVRQAVSALRDLGATRLAAVVGPSVCGRCYEVPLAMREEAATVQPESRTVTWSGTPAIDVAAGVVAQLSALDVAVTWLPGCAREDDSLFSHRRDGVTGRFGGVVVRRVP
jgi:YfiH family protein